MNNPRSIFFGTLAGVTIVLIVVFKMSIQNSLSLKSENQWMLQKLETYSDFTEDQLIQLQEKESNLDALIGGDVSKGKNFQQQLLSFLAPIGDKYALRLTEIPTVITTEKEEYNYINASLKFEGSFKNLLRMVNEIERDCKVGKLVSVDYKIEKDRRLKKNKLYGTYYFQKISG